MKKAIFALLLLLAASVAFAEPGPVSSFGISGAYPISETADVGEHMLLNLFLYGNISFTFEGGSPAFNPGLSAVVRTNILMLLSGDFFGGIGLRLYNEFDLGGPALQVYGEPAFNVMNSSRAGSFIYFEVAGGLRLILKPLDIDLAVIFPLVDDNLRGTSVEPIGLRLALGYAF